jgi:hypothetical protein
MFNYKTRKTSKKFNLPQLRYSQCVSNLLQDKNEVTLGFAFSLRNSITIIEFIICFIIFYL